MRNDVLAPASPTSVVADLADRAVDERRAAYTDEVQRLLDAACAVMRESGDIEPRVSDVVRTAGLSNQAFYRHFASKDALLLAVLTDGRQRLLATLTARM
ncbi:MAG: TetR/AcrR family transcriptional regulator, partial [Actinomycetota bacterium]